ncbi:MAG TPA: aminomethyl-transferring glycine dehydrogenase [Verrucomicrobia bacterium]|nr:aminomethyl-transferring glycine dehydrogenase [Verrucomicrobiota bacterium]HOP96958.1 aminomethyl-transferring glycine dehydrogenase [Verrucomicrobiota bacterium]
MSFSTHSGSSQSDPFPHPDRFVTRHIGPNAEETREMLALLGFKTLDQLTDAAVPPQIRLTKPLSLPPPMTEYHALQELRKIAGRNKVFRSFIGMGFYDCITPPVIQRNVLENPGWYTQYTPYQAEISQGRLEALLNFQTMVSDLTAMDISNASLLDEATACAEAMTMCHALSQGRNVFFISETCHPQNIAVVRTRASAVGIELVIGDHEHFQFNDRVFGALVQSPDTFGSTSDLRPFIERAHAAGAMVVVATDLLALMLMQPPGETGADVAVGSAQRFGVPLAYGGPHAGFFATRDRFKRHMPGRLVGVSKDSRGRPALRLALQTREQHIRREKATSNICTAQALLANISSLYAVYHGPEGLKRIAERVHGLTRLLAAGAQKLGHRVLSTRFFDTLRIRLTNQHSTDVARIAESHRINLRIIDAGSIGISLDETTSTADVMELLQVLNGDQAVGFTPAELAPAPSDLIPRATACLKHKVFNSYHCETEMLRYIKRLESRDLSLTASMIPLGSCTMKLNAAAEMAPISWPEFARLHPFAPLEQAEGYQLLFRQLEQWLAEITGLHAVSLQPNAGSQGEYTGLLVIRAYHKSRGEEHRRVCLIPTSAHGTNPASAALAGMKIVPVACDRDGNIDVNDLRSKAEAHRAELACLMVTYPSTHGVFEPTIREICDIIHANGGQVYMDGANMNAQVGLTSPGRIGADVCHLNLHKTFCIPHGGGGPGVGPICVARHLAPFLPGHAVVRFADPDSRIGQVASAPWGSPGILPISWMYIAMMGAEGLTRATQYAVLNANYIAKRLENHFPTLYRSNGLVAHECILDLRAFKSVTAEDVAKRLMDYGFHAPTLSWPVAGTLMVEPTESESKAELDRFCDAMIAIHAEMRAVETGQADSRNNLLKGAPHTADMIASDGWDRPYSRQQAAFPVAGLLEYKFWPHVGRVDNVFGDRNPVCTCAGMEAWTAPPSSAEG